MAILIRFTAGSRSYRLTSGSSPERYAGAEYQPCAFEIGQIIREGSLGAGGLTVTLPASDTYGLTQAIFQGTPAGWGLSVRVGEPRSQSYRQVFKGDVISASYGKKERITIKATSLDRRLKRPGALRAFQTRCPHRLYDSFCQAPKIFRTVSASFGSGVLRVSPPGDGSSIEAYRIGFLEGVPEGDPWDSSVQRITERPDAGWDVQAWFPESLEGTEGEVRLLPGCDKALQTCGVWHNNQLNFGGLPYMVTLNPIGKTSTYF